MEITTEDVEEFVNNSPGRIVLRLPLFSGSDVAIDRALGFVKSLEDAWTDMDLIVYSKNALTHEKVVPDVRRDTKAKMCEWVIDGLHLDYLPYTDVIISIPENEKNLELIRKLCLRYGVLDVDDILVKNRLIDKI